MNPKWAEENLQTIRTLMERSAIYRRALAPIMIFAGMLGMAAAAVGVLFDVKSMRTFDALWLGTATLVVIGAFFIARRQAIHDKENFWSPPTRRVAHALLVPLAVGLFFSVLPICLGLDEPALNEESVLVWILFYGCALHSAGFFMPRGIKLFGLIFVAADLAIILAALANWLPDWLTKRINAHLVMGFFFGVLHLAYGIYLYFTEKKNFVA